MRRLFVSFIAASVLVLGQVVTTPSAQAATDTCSYWAAQGWPVFTVGTNPRVRYATHPFTNDTSGPYWVGTGTTLCVDAATQHIEATWQTQFGGPQYGLVPYPQPNNHFVEGAYVGAGGPVVAGTGAFVDVWPYVTPDPGNSATSTNYTVTFPFTVCVGPMGSSPCPVGSTTTQTVAKTGVVYNTVTLNAPPTGTSQGFTLTTGSTIVCVNGVCQPVPTSGQSAGAGANTNNLTPTAGTTNFPVCTAPGNCTNVPIPTGAKVTYNNLPVAVVSVNTTTVTVKPPLSSCYSAGQPQC